MIEIGIIAIDIDGTLLNNDFKISGENVQAIKKAQDLGCEVVIATGRAHYDARRIVEQTGLSLHIIGSNGATIHTPDNKELFSASISYEEAEEIIVWLENHDFYYEITGDKGIYTRINSKDILYREMEKLEEEWISKHDPAIVKHTFETQVNQTGFVFMDDFRKIYQDGQRVYNIYALSFDDEKRTTGRKTLANATNLTMVYSSPFNFEFHSPDCSKGQAVKYLSRTLNINMERSMAIGDSGNDIAMFEVVSNSYAMINADDHVKSKAKFVTLSNDDHGVAKAIYDFLEIK